VFKYSTSPDTEIIVEPKLTQESSLLFYPKSQKVTVTDECIDNIVFQAKSGLIINGKIDPPVEDVDLFIYSNEELVSQAKSDKQGNYRVGPLYDDLTYEIRASKEDYNFQGDGKGNFKAQKLSSLTVSVKDQDGSPIEGVFLQLSAGKGFRLTGTSDIKG